MFWVSSNTSYTSPPTVTSLCFSSCPMAIPKMGKFSSSNPMMPRRMYPVASIRYESKFAAIFGMFRISSLYLKFSMVYLAVSSISRDTLSLYFPHSLTATYSEPRLVTI